MSTKIYNGYFSYLTMEELLPKFKEFGLIVKDSVNEIFLESLIKEAIRIYDSSTEEKHIWEIIYELYKKAQEDVQKLTDYQRAYGPVEIDFRTNCIIFPPFEDKTLILFYCDLGVITKLWEELDYIEDYHYQNSTDGPEDISEQDWEKRSNDWDKVLGGDGWGKPIDNGYEFTFYSKDVPNLYLLATKVKDEFIPSDDKRKKSLLHDKLWNECFKNSISKLEVSDYINWRMEFNEKYKSGQFIEELDKIELKTVNLKDRNWNS